MKIDELSKGMTVYYPKVNKLKRTTYSLLEVQVLKYFVLDVDVKTRLVTASCNGGAAASYKAHEYSRWQAKKPTEDQTGAKRIKRASPKRKRYDL